MATKKAATKKTATKKSAAKKSPAKKTATKAASKKTASKKSAAKKGGSSASGHTLSTDQRNKMSESTYAFPKQRKEPLNNASHVRSAIARFDQVQDVSDADRGKAFTRIKSAAKKFGVEMNETSWKELGKK
jgi:hypothetical protein